MTITAQEFEENYAKLSGVTVHWLAENGRVVRPCACENNGCQGWRMAFVAEEEMERELQAIYERYDV